MREVGNESTKVRGQGRGKEGWPRTRRNEKAAVAGRTGGGGRGGGRDLSSEPGVD